jgi:hypothetical protein
MTEPRFFVALQHVSSGTLAPILAFVDPAR